MVERELFQHSNYFNTLSLRINTAHGQVFATREKLAQVMELVPNAQGAYDVSLRGVLNGLRATETVFPSEEQLDLLYGISQQLNQVGLLKLVQTLRSESQDEAQLREGLTMTRAFFEQLYREANQVREFTAHLLASLAVSLRTINMRRRDAHSGNYPYTPEEEQSLELLKKFLVYTRDIKKGYWNYERGLAEADKLLADLDLPPMHQSHPTSTAQPDL